MGFGTVVVTKHTSLTDKEVAGVIDHANVSITDAKLASGVGLEDGQLCKLPVAAVGKALMRGAAEWEPGDPTGGIANVKIGYFTRNAGGSQSVTGVGFKPKAVIFFAVSEGVAPSYLEASWGFDDGTVHHCTYNRGDAVSPLMLDTESVVAWDDDTSILVGHITSMDADGFTMAWTLTGARSVDVVYLAIK